MDNRDVVDGERIARGAQVDEPTDVIFDPPSPVLAEPGVVDRIDLLARALGYVPMFVEQVVLIAELVAGQDLRDAHGRQQAGEGELDPLLAVDHVVPLQVVVESLVPFALDVVRGEVDDRLG